MDLVSLSIFRAVANELSVTKAAQQLGRYPSSVTTRLQQLEEELGVPLFDREKKAFVLTSAGEQFLNYANRILNLSDEAKDVVNPSTPSGVLRVGSMECTIASRLPPVLATFSNKWPSVTFDLTTAPTRQLTQAVQRYEIDCAFVAFPKDEWWADIDGLEKTRIVTEELLLILPPGHPPVNQPKDVLPQRMAAFARGCAYRSVAEDWLTGYGTSDRHFQINEVKSYHAIIASVSAGSCVGAVPRSVLELNRSMSPVESISLAEIDTYLIWRQDAQTSAVKAFKEAVLATDFATRRSVEG
ncbi:LysR family transcriptional regulator [Agrobacterium tumefaciens]|uniref:LysR family transcriptional regulator n=1 Tax=Agrobacterium tumefaciens TaxID=358 RepID=UPI00287D0D7D|nr:LysR family transcriptional regulator [Agrobacterium tumefaciens]MDS7595466.1 LysR family transcriptional regulator [Agrobacterium tumefaciens]